MIKKSLDRLFVIFGAAAILLLAGCETVPLEPAPNFDPNMIVSQDYAQFFRLGPQQAGGADRSLRTGDFVMLQRKEFGYSRVQLEDGMVGYMANEDIQPAPPRPKPSPTPKIKSQHMARQGEFIDNNPVTDGDLDILPEDIPLEPLPELLPEPPMPDAPKREVVPVVIPAPTPPPVEPQKETLPEKTPTPATTPVSTST